eukprot:Filipodium_phascolosomae@DN2191_c0_g1_i2.p1
MRMRYTLLSVAALISASIPPRLFALHSENGINGPILRESAPPERIVDFEKNPNLEKSAPTRSTAGSLHDTVPFTIPTASSAEDYGPQKNGINQNSPSRHQSAALSANAQQSTPGFSTNTLPALHAGFGIAVVSRPYRPCNSCR